jgi:hypothetical protein
MGSEVIFGPLAHPIRNPESKRHQAPILTVFVVMF